MRFLSAKQNSQPNNPDTAAEKPSGSFFRTWLGRIETACLVVFDVAATYGAFWVATWGTAAGEQLFGSPQG